MVLKSLELLLPGVVTQPLSLFGKSPAQHIRAWPSLRLRLQRLQTSKSPFTCISLHFQFFFLYTINYTKDQYLGVGLSLLPARNFDQAWPLA